MAPIARPRHGAPRREQRHDLDLPQPALPAPLKGRVAIPRLVLLLLLLLLLLLENRSTTSRSRSKSRSRNKRKSSRPPRTLPWHESCSRQSGRYGESPHPAKGKPEWQEVGSSWHDPQGG